MATVSGGQADRGSPSARTVRRLGLLAIALAAVELMVASVMALAGNPDGLLGAVLFLVMFALPLLVVGTALLLERPRWWPFSGWTSLVLALGCAAIVPLNWEGYSAAQAWVAVAVTTPAVALYLVIFWATVIRIRRPSARLSSRPRQAREGLSNAPRAHSTPGHRPRL